MMKVISFDPAKPVKLHRGSSSRLAQVSQLGLQMTTASSVGRRSSVDVAASAQILEVMIRHVATLGQGDSCPPPQMDALLPPNVPLAFFSTH